MHPRPDDPMGCPELERLIAWDQGDESSGGAEDGDVRTHLELGCPRCAKRLRALHSVLAELRKGPLPRASARLIERAAALGESGVADPAGTAEHLGTPAPSLAGAGRTAMRGGGLTRRHHLYHAGPYDLDVAYLEDGTVVGQVLPVRDGVPPIEHATCILFGEHDVGETAMRPTGDFHFGRRAPGIYRLVIEADAVRLVVPDVDLNDARHS